MKFLLGFVFALFVGIMIYVYVETKRIAPQILDEKGQRI